jgi:putative PIN family toxin of toxin-antitoxin system
MRVVADTNVVISGLLWRGPSRRILDQARAGALTLFTTPELLAELLDVLQRPKLERRLEKAGATPWELVAGYGVLASLVAAPPQRPVVVEDPDDDRVLECAVACAADLIVSGDRHLLVLSEHQGIPVVRARDAIEAIGSGS